MKSIFRTLTAAAALLLAGNASADVTIYLTGSTAFRGATSNAIKNLFTSLNGSGTYTDGSGAHSVTYGFAYDGSSYSGSNHQMLIGTVSGISGVVIVKTSWSGSLAGIQALDTPSTPPPNYSYYNNPWDATSPVTVSWNGGSGVVVATPPTASLPSGNCNDTSNATIAMADNTQGATPFNNTSLVDSEVGIVPFTFVASYSAPSGLTNVTPQLFTNLFKAGYCSASLFTNSDADRDNNGGTRVFAAGRDPLSGTRLNTFAETGFGINTACAQWENTNALSGTTITSIKLYPGDSSLLTPVGSNDGEDGFSSGGSLANMLRYDTSSCSATNNRATGKVCFVSYLGESDAVTAVATGTAGAGNGRLLTYNGVTAFGGVQVSASDASWTSGSNTITSATTGKWTGCIVGQLVRCTGFGGDTIITAIDGTKTILTVSKNATTTQASGGSASTSIILPTPIWNGTYTLWGYEHILWAPGTSGDQLTFGNALKTQISTVDYYTSGLSLDSSMKVARTSEGGTVSQNY